jgi:signal transduction histidine kinase
MGATGTTATSISERTRVEAVVETLAAIHHHGENLGELAHDARNMVTALSLYCDLLDEPGVLAARHRHYASELRLVAEASRRLVEKLSLLDRGEREETVATETIPSRQSHLFPLSLEPVHSSSANGMEPLSGGLITDLGAELRAVRDLLAAIAGPSINLVARADDGACPVRMTSENLIRALVNLVKNSAESIQGPGAIELTLAEGFHCDGTARWLVLCLEDSGCGIPPGHREEIFEPGFTTRAGVRPDGGWTSSHRGLGLSITRSIVEAAGGRIHAENRLPRGARFVIELPVWESNPAA